MGKVQLNTGVAGDQAFVRVAEFGGHAGELLVTYDSVAGRTLVQGDVDGDGAADLDIAVTGNHVPDLAFLL